MSEQSEQLEREAAFAAMGKQVINNEAYKQAIMVRKAQIFELFCNSNVEQLDVREEAWRTMKNTNALEQFFEIALTTGKMANLDLDKMKKE